MKKFLENKKGVHLMGIEQGGEFTLCGDAFDIYGSVKDYPDGELKPTTKTIVTCKDCIKNIKHCKNVRFKE